MLLCFMLYIIFASDLKLLSAINFLYKYADDKTLMVLENTNISLEDEFRHIMQWSVQNKLTLNFTKNLDDFSSFWSLSFHCSATSCWH